MKKQVPPPLLIPKSPSLARALTDKPRSMQNLSSSAGLSKSMTSFSPLTKTGTKESLRYYMNPDAEGDSDEDDQSLNSGLATPQSVMGSMMDLKSAGPASAIPAIVTPTVVVKSARDLRSTSNELGSPSPSPSLQVSSMPAESPKKVQTSSHERLEKAKSDSQLTPSTPKFQVTPASPLVALENLETPVAKDETEDKEEEEEEELHDDILQAKQKILSTYKLIVTLTSNINKTKQKLLKSGLFVPPTTSQSNLGVASVDFDADEFDDLDDEFMAELETFLQDHEQRMATYRKLTEIMKALMERVQQSILAKSKDNSVVQSSLVSPVTMKGRDKSDLTRSGSGTTIEGGISKSSTKRSMSTISSSHITKSQTSSSFDHQSVTQSSTIERDPSSLGKRNSSIRTPSSSNTAHRAAGAHIPHSLSTLTSSSETSHTTTSTSSKATSGKSKATQGTYELDDIRDIMQTTNFGDLQTVETTEEPKQQESFFQDILDMYGLSDNGESEKGK